MEFQILTHIGEKLPSKAGHILLTIFLISFPYSW